MNYIYDGQDHPYYQYGRSYTLRIERTLFHRIVIYVPRGYEKKVTDGSYIKYKNFAAFKAQWRRG